MITYKIEELLPIVAELTDRYTSKESTSISYEKARQLMEAVLYCIHHCEAKEQLVSSNGVSAREAYQYGYEGLIEKVKKTQIAYNQMISNFSAYGNENYYDTVTKAIPGFFQYYDVRFAPQETIITMDYPTLCPITGSSGIDAIEKYVEYISYEQKFMKALPQQYILEILSGFQAGYKKQFYNICRIPLRHILGHMMINKSLAEETRQEDYHILQEIILRHDNKWLEERFVDCLEKLIQEKYENDRLLFWYLQSDVKDFAVEICVGAKNNAMEKVVVL